MTNIKIDCFIGDNLCQVNSSDKSIQISSPLEKEIFLEIFNHGQNDCELLIRASNFSTDHDLETINLMIYNAEQIFFKDNLLVLREGSTVGLISATSSASYFFSIDLLNLVLEEKSLSLNFDLLFDFNCEEAINNSNQIKNTNVLSASSSATEEIPSSDSFFKSPFLFFLLSSLFVIIFFVIMKVINGQKKKKQA